MPPSAPTGYDAGLGMQSGGGLSALEAARDGVVSCVSSPPSLLHLRPAPADPDGFQDFLDELDQNDIETRDDPSTSVFLSRTPAGVHDGSYDSDEDEILALPLSDVKLWRTPADRRAFSEFLASSVKSATRTGYGTGLRLWDQFLAASPPTSSDPVFHRFLAHIPEEHKVSIILAQFVQFLYERGYRGKAVSKVMSGLRFASSITHPFLDRGFDSHLVQTAKKACAMSRSELLDYYSRSLQRRKAPVPIEILTSARASHWDHPDASWSRDGGKGLALRGAYVAMLLSMNNAFRIGHVAPDGSKDHVILAGSILFDITPSQSFPAVASGSFPGGGRAREVLRATYPHNGPVPAGLVSCVQKASYFIATSKTRNSIGQQYSASTSLHAKGTLEPFSLDRSSELSAHLLDVLVEWELHSNNTEDDNFTGYAYPATKYNRGKQLRSISGQNGAFA